MTDARRKISRDAYRATAKYRRTKQAYKQTESYKLTIAKYHTTDDYRSAIQRYQHTPKGKWHQYRNNAKNRGGITFELTFEQFMSLWEKPCYYCGDPIATVGLDRTDNAKGYALTNVVPCCTICNKAKLKMGEQEYIAHYRKVAHNFQEAVCLQTPS